MLDVPALNVSPVVTVPKVKKPVERVLLPRLIDLVFVTVEVNVPQVNE